MTREFEIECLLPLSETQVSLEPGKAMARTDPKLTQMIEERWAAETQKRMAAGRPAPYNGKKLRFSHYRFDGKGNVILGVAITDYKDFSGTNMRAITDPSYRELLTKRGLEEFGDDSAFYSNALGVDTLVEANDGRFIFGLRSQSGVGLYPGFWHVIGGTVDVKDPSTLPNPFAGARQEVGEELYTSTDKITSMSLLGIARSVPMRHYVAAFHVRLDLAHQEILELQSSSKKNEHRRLEAVPREKLATFLKTNSGRLVPDGEATAFMYMLNQGMDMGD